MRLPLKHLAIVVAVALGVLFVGVLFPLWSDAVEQNRDARADPHHIAGNLFFVGAPDVASFLLTSDEGHVLIDTGYWEWSGKLFDSIEQLGFDAADIKVLLITDAHQEHAGGLKAIQRASDAELWASEANAAVIATGGKTDPSIVYTPYRLFTRLGITDYPAPVVDHRLSDGHTIRLGPIAVTAHLTPGHSQGCTSFSFTVREGTRDLRVVHRCALDPPAGASFVDPEQYPGIRSDFEKTFQTLRNLPVDIWLTAHGREYGRYRKYQESVRALAAKADPVAPFIDPKGYFAAIDTAEEKFRTLLAAQRK